MYTVSREDAIRFLIETHNEGTIELNRMRFGGCGTPLHWEVVTSPTTNEELPNLRLMPILWLQKASEAYIMNLVL